MKRRELILVAALAMVLAVSLWFMLDAKVLVR
jgi:hypothetical protein